MNDADLQKLLALPCFVFDMDGVLVDSNQAHADAFRAVLDDYSLHFGEYAQYAGWSTPDVIKDVLIRNGKRPDDELVLELTARKQQMAIENIRRGHGISPIPGAVELLSAAAKRGKRVALVTSAARKRMELVLNTLQISGFFEHTVSADDVEQGKPSPLPYQTAMKLIGELDPQRCLVFEDSDSGLESASAAGMRLIYFSHAGKTDSRADFSLSDYSRLTGLLREEE